VAMAGAGPSYATVAALQVLFYALAVAGWPLRKTTAGRSAVLFVPLFFCLANAAAMLAWWNVARGSRIELWSPQRHTPIPSAVTASGLDGPR
jgi:uncharacterized membrane protein YjdF